MAVKQGHSQNEWRKMQSEQTRRVHRDTPWCEVFHWRTADTVKHTHIPHALSLLDGLGDSGLGAAPLVCSSDHGRAAAPPAAATTGLSPQVAALRIASKPSALDISAVVWQLRREPPAANARAIAAAETLSGISVMSTASYCPNAKYEFSTLPPSFSMGARTESNRSWGLASNRVRASGV